MELPFIAELEVRFAILDVKRLVLLNLVYIVDR